MTHATPTGAGETPDAQPPRRKSALVWRVLAVAAIVAATALTAHVLVRPGRGVFGGHEATQRQEDALFESPTPVPREVPESEWADARSDLARVMAGILTAAAAEEGDYQDPANQTPEDRQQFLEEQFGLPTGYPQTAAPAELVPDGAEVLAVFESPESAQKRMVLLRMAMPTEDALAAFRDRYAAQGWTMQPMAEAKEQTDRGWLMWFVRGRSHRAVFVQPNDDAKETLAAVCDLGYE